MATHKFSPLCASPPTCGATHTGVFVIPQGEEWSMVDASTGDVSFLSGPCKLWCVQARLTQRRMIVANESEFIEIRYTAGHSEVIPGPASLAEHPLDHQAVRVKPAISINNNEALVVYREALCKAGDKAVVREIVRGPVLYKPKTASEWTHAFSWHGHDPSGDHQQLARKRPHALKFSKLLLAPSSTYFDVENVRTADDALLTVRLMIFYTLASVEKMLDATNDPIADIINAVSSDVISFCSARSFEQFKEHAEQLNLIGLYQNLTTTVETRGVTVSKVVFRGFVAPGALQKMHDDAIQKRTKLVLERETELQEQKQADERLAKEEQRARVKRSMEAEQKAHAATLQRTAFEARQKEQKEEAEQETALEEARKESELTSLAKMQSDLDLKGSDIAALLVARAHVPAKLIQVTGGAQPVVHLDQ